MVAAEDPRLWPVTAVAVVIAPTIGIATVVDNYVDPLLIWGGYRCEAADGIQLCAGYSPAGLLLIWAAVTVIAVYGAVQIEQRYGE